MKHLMWKYTFRKKHKLLPDPFKRKIQKTFKSEKYCSPPHEIDTCNYIKRNIFEDNI